VVARLGVTELSLTTVDKHGGTTAAPINVERVLLAGYTGRDRASVMQHIEELRELGVKPPERVPMVYEVGAELLTTASRIEVTSASTSGEVEFYLVQTPDGVLVGVGSDHTDREAEAIDVAESKRRCPKVISAHAWRYADVVDHWDEITIRAWVSVHGVASKLYQDGRLDAFLRVDDLLSEIRAAGYADDALQRAIVFSGTIPTTGGFVFAHHFEAELRDPVLNRVLTCAYGVDVRV
jgi:hypothetical protein